MANIRFRKDRTWKKFAKALDSKQFRSIGQKMVNDANGRIGLRIRGEVRRKIQRKEFDANAALTVAIKGSSTPLVDTSAGIWGSITVVQPAWNFAFVGVMRTDEMYNIAKALHEGVDIKVTPKMRAMFFYLWLASMGRGVELKGRAKELFERMKTGWKPLKEGTTAIHIPPRPFLQAAMEEDRVKNYARTQWRAAIQATIRLMMQA